MACYNMTPVIRSLLTHTREAQQCVRLMVLTWPCLQAESRYV